MLPRAQRLVSAADHRLVARRGHRCRRDSLMVSFVADGRSRTAGLLAVVVPKTVGSAPVRNRLRRRLQNLAAPHMAGLPTGSLVVVRADAGALRLGPQTLQSAFAAALSGALSGATSGHRR